MNKKLYVIPNVLTTANITCGILSCIFSINDALKIKEYTYILKPFELSSILILFAVFFDLIDGVIARLTKSNTKFGVEYDSLADLVSFGVAPAVLIYLAVMRDYGKIGWLFVTIYVVCGAIRLARYNATAKNAVKNFVGLPIPAAAGVLVSYVLFSMWGEFHFSSGVMGWYEQRVSYINQVIIPVGTIILSMLMVSNVRYPRWRKYMIKGKINFINFVEITMIVILIILTPIAITSFIIALSYLLSGPVISILKKEKKYNTSEQVHVKEGGIT